MLSAAYEKKAAKFLKKLTVKEDVKRIIDKVDELTKNPFPTDAKRVEGREDVKVFRIRVGQYRILYFIEQETATIYIVNIDKRERAY